MSMYEATYTACFRVTLTSKTRTVNNVESAFHSHYAVMKSLSAVT